MFWTVESYPECTHHVFLSHSAEDREFLVLPVYERLLSLGVRPWLDRHDYTYGRSSRAALRDGILNSRHTVFFVTDAMLEQSRGWCVQELTLAELLQDSLTRPGGAWQTVMLPLYFVGQTNPLLPRSVWQLGRDRGVFRPKGFRRVDWAVDQIVKFLRNEQRLAEHCAEVTAESVDLKSQLAPRVGLHRRVTRFDPAALPTHAG